MADAADSKSVARKGVWVQVPPPALRKRREVPGFAIWRPPVLYPKSGNCSANCWENHHKTPPPTRAFHGDGLMQLSLSGPAGRCLPGQRRDQVVLQAGGADASAVAERDPRACHPFAR